jgi:hypothetical protein
MPCYLHYIRARLYLTVFEMFREGTTSTIIDRLLNRNASGTTRGLTIHSNERIEISFTSHKDFVGACSAFSIFGVL